MNRDIVTLHLEESVNKIRSVLQKITTDDYSEHDFSVDLANVYRHLNASWNGRGEDLSQNEALLDEEFEKHHCFPTNNPFSLLHKDNTGNEKWYLADLVMALTVEGNKGNLVHINSTLIVADSDESAYQSALLEGKEYESEYLNPDHKLVKMKFLGLHDLAYIDNDIDHGTEVIYAEKKDLTKEAIASLLKKKTQLHLFREDRGNAESLSFMPKDVWESVVKLQEENSQ